MSIERPGTEGIVAEAVEAFVRRGGKSGRRHQELLAEVGAEHGDAAAEKALAELRAAGRVIQADGFLVAAGSSKLTVGSVEALDSGDAVVRPADSLERPLFVPRRKLKGAIDGDRVLVRRTSKGKRDGLPVATVLEVLDRRYETVVGFVEADDADRLWLVPFDSKVGLQIELTHGLGEAAGETTATAARDHLGDYVVVAVDPHTTDPGYVKGRVVELLGDVDEPGVDVAVVLRHYRIPEDFPAGALAAAASFPEDPTVADVAGRTDLRGTVTVTIDGESARDFDDAISVEEIPGGGARVGVHIADVSHYVEEGGALDREAYRRGTSVYYPDRAIPMLPEGLSNGLCSLRPDVPRLTMSVFLDIGEDGEIRRRSFAKSVIRSARRMTYEEVRRLLEEPRQDDASEYGAVLPMLQAARSVMRRRHAERMARGSLDFDLPSGDVVLDTDGYVVGIKPGERTVAHRIIEELMIAANEAVAAELVSHEIEALFRVHDPPDRTLLEELRELLRPFGIPLKGDLENLHPSVLQEVLARVEGRPEEPFVATVVLRAQKQAMYSASCDGHYALASRYYLHFTSPIRRYPDLVAHRRLKALLDGREEDEVEAALLAARMPVMAERTSHLERRAERSERDLLQWKKVRFLADRVGERFSGRVTGVKPFGLFVQLDGLYVDGLVPIAKLGDEYYRYEPDARQLVGARSGLTYRLAQEVEVELVGVSDRHRGLDLVIAGSEPKQTRPPSRPEEPATGSRRRRGRRRR